VLALAQRYGRQVGEVSGLISRKKAQKLIGAQEQWVAPIGALESCECSGRLFCAFLQQIEKRYG
jgi:hypothetical protein